MLLGVVVVVGVGEALVCIVGVGVAAKWHHQKLLPTFGEPHQQVERRGKVVAGKVAGKVVGNGVVEVVVGRTVESWKGVILQWTKRMQLIS